MYTFNLSGKLSKGQVQEFADGLIDMQSRIDYKVSARGWCYILEGQRVINKDQFDRAEHYINKCRKEGTLPVDFVAEETAREFSGVDEPDERTLQEYIRSYVKAPLSCYKWYSPDWWENENYYIQMVVEKTDLKTLASPITEQYHIPIANSKGWSSVLQRATYARRFKEAEERGLKCVLLYCGDFDPDGLRIGEFLRSNLQDISNIVWEDGTAGYDPSELIIERFGLNYDFIIAHKLTWIDNLFTGRGGDLESPSHKNNSMPYVQSYLKNYGARKCEANAIILKPKAAADLVRKTIEKYLGKDALSRFADIREGLKDKAETLFEETGLKASIQKTLDYLDEHDDLD